MQGRRSAASSPASARDPARPGPRRDQASAPLTHSAFDRGGVKGKVAAQVLEGLKPSVIGERAGLKRNGDQEQRGKGENGALPVHGDLKGMRQSRIRPSGPRDPQVFRIVFGPVRRDQPVASARTSRPAPSDQDSCGDTPFVSLRRNPSPTLPRGDYNEVIRPFSSRGQGRSPLGYPQTSVVATAKRAVTVSPGARPG